jgi:hypothetical protein
MNESSAVKRIGADARPKFSGRIWIAIPLGEFEELGNAMPSRFAPDGIDTRS